MKERGVGVGGRSGGGRWGSRAGSSPIAINSASLTFPRHPLQHTPSFPLTISTPLLPIPSPSPSYSLSSPPPPLYLSAHAVIRMRSRVRVTACHIILHNVCRHHIHLPNALPTCTRNAHCYNTYFSLFITMIYYCYYYIFHYPLLPPAQTRPFFS